MIISIYNLIRIILGDIETMFLSNTYLEVEALQNIIENFL